jgi:hypothetical protein
VTNSKLPGVSQKKANVFPVVPAVPAGRYSWRNPDESLLEDRRGDLPEFPHETIPSRLQGWLLLAARGAGVRTDHIAVPMLGVASSLIGKARRIRASSSWPEPMTLWVCVVAASGDRKTPGFQVVLRALDRIEKENTPQYREARLAHQLRAEKAKAELKRWRKACQEALEAKPPGEPPPMPIDAVDPGEFIHPSLYVQDCTIQRLAMLCNVRPRGMLQIRDEMSGLFTNIQRQSSARAFYLEAWNGLRYVVERVDDDRSINVENLLVGLMGGFQPDKLSRAFSGDEDGMYARFLFGWPTTPAYSPLTDDVAEVAPEFQRLLTRLIRLPAEDQDGQFAPRSIPLSADARASFEDYRRYVDQTKRALEGREQQWLVKSETQVLRLAGTLAYLDWASLQDAPSSAMGVERISASMEPDTIGERFMADAIRLMREYFWPHARAALRQIGLTDRHIHMRRTLRWIRVHRMEAVSVKDVRREALGGSLDADQTLELLDRMTTAGWLRHERASTGGRPLERWHVNPKIFETANAETAGTAESPEQSPG